MEITNKFKNYKMNTFTIEIEILAPIQKVWKTISTTEGMKDWLGWRTIESNWQVNNPIVFTLHDKKGNVMEFEGEKMIFNGIIEIKKENKEIAYTYPEKLIGIEKESYLLTEIDAETTLVFYSQICTSEEDVKYEDCKQLMDSLKKKLEE